MNFLNITVGLCSVDRKRTATCNEIAVTTKQIKYQSDEIIDLGWLSF